jgi:hypothetical protein
MNQNKSTMYTRQQKELILKFRWLCSDLAARELGYELQIQKLRKMALEAADLAPCDHQELFIHFGKGGNIKPGDPIKSAQYLESLLCCTHSFDRLIILYPTIYAIDFTFCVPDGWLDVLDNLSDEISVLLAQHPKFSIEISDIKEKHHQLKLYYSLSGPEQDYDELDQQIEVFIEDAGQYIQTIERVGGGE